MFPLYYDVNGIYLQNCGCKGSMPMMMAIWNPISGIISILQTRAVECA